jgi:hypothetical protein
MKKNLLISAALAVTGMGLLAVPASAEVVCNAAGDCWKTATHYEYKPEWKVVVHPDTWYEEHKADKALRWRESHEGRGYWRDGVWVTF